MKIIYRQTESDSIFSLISVKSLHYKSLSEKSSSFVTKKEHHHTGFEIHIIEKGTQTYIINEKSIHLKSGHIFIIPPGCRHRCSDRTFSVSKTSLSFAVEPGSPFCHISEPTVINTDKKITENIRFLLSDINDFSYMKQKITENRIFEIMIIILHLWGYKGENVALPEFQADDRIALAKDYIKDNLFFAVTVSETAAYCHLSAKHLTRLFEKYEQITPKEYIIKEKIKVIEKLLLKGLPLSQISEKMNFSSEYHFNSFFKKYSGMPPGEYKRMYVQTRTE